MTPTHPPTYQRYGYCPSSPYRGSFDDEDPLLADFPDMELPDCGGIDRMLKMAGKDSPPMVPDPAESVAFNLSPRAMGGGSVYVAQGPTYGHAYPFGGYYENHGIHHHYQHYGNHVQVPSSMQEHFNSGPPSPVASNAAFPYPVHSVGHSDLAQEFYHDSYHQSPRRVSDASHQHSTRCPRREETLNQHSENDQGFGTPKPNKRQRTSRSAQRPREERGDEESVGVSRTRKAPKSSRFEDDESLVAVSSGSGVDTDSISVESHVQPQTQLDENGTLHRYRYYQTDIWTKKFDMLLQYSDKNGHCNVPHSYKPNPELAQWVKRQRYQYKLKLKGKRSTLSDERQKRLDDIGFIWDAHRALWEERFSELKAYADHHGNCNVPSRSRDYPQLSVWVKCQRRQFRLLCDGDPTSNMTQERIDKLEKLGIVWSPRGSVDN